MGLLQYKAHCNSSADASYAIATESEMRTFLQNLNVHLSFEQVRQGTDGKKYFNIMLRFDPFPIKYLNYIKRYNRPRKGASYWSRGEAVQGMYNKDDNQRMVYVQLFRIPRRGGSDAFNSASLRNSIGWGQDYFAEECWCAWQNGYEAKIYGITYNTVIPCGTLLYKPVPRFKHPLTPMAAAKGSVMMLQECIILERGSNSLRLEFGTNGRSQQNFRHGLVAGFAYNGSYAYNSEADTLTMRNTHGLI
jgi:hypothetical protein